MYATVAAAAALHQVLLRSLGEDKVVVQNVASGLFCVLFVALGVAGRPTLLATSMLGYLISDSTSVTTAGYALHHAVTAMLLLVSLRGNGAYDDLTVVLGGYGEASTVLLCVADTFKQRPRLQKAYPRANRAVRYAFALAFLVLRVGYWSAWILEKGKGPLPVRVGLYALLGLQYYWGVCISRKVARSVDRFRRPRGKHRPVCCCVEIKVSRLLCG